MSDTPRTDEFRSLRRTVTESEEFERGLERELNEARSALSDRANEIAGSQAFVALHKDTCEKLSESQAREAQLREALSLPSYSAQHIPCICYGKDSTQVQVGYVCAKCKALTLPPPPVVPLEAVTLLVDALRNAEATLMDADGSRYHVDGDACLTKQARGQRNSSLTVIAEALATFTSKHKL